MTTNKIDTLLDQLTLEEQASLLAGAGFTRMGLAPTRLYVKQALAAVRAGGVHALAHITGGGLTENPPRVIPEGLACEIDLSAWELPAVFRWLATTANMSQPELLKTFNCGIGMIAVVA